MLNVNDLIRSRTTFESIVLSDNSNTAGLERSVYDLMVESYSSYMDNFRREALGNVKYFRGNPNVSDIDITSREMALVERFGSRPAYIIGINYDPEKHVGYVEFGEMSSPLVGKDFVSGDSRKMLLELGYKDGAILVDSSGKVSIVRSRLRNIPVEGSIPPTFEGEGLKQYGFLETVGTRHPSALGASYHLKGSIFYTLSEESGNIRRYENGKITFSTLNGEVKPS